MSSLEDLELIKMMDEYLDRADRLKRTNPELAKKLAREGLQRAGIIGVDEEFLPPYNGEKVNEFDFTRGPGEIDNGDER